MIEGAAESLLELLMLEEDASEADVTAAFKRLQANRKLGTELVPRPLVPLSAACRRCSGANAC